MSSLPPVVAVEIPSVGDERLKTWAKVVHAVDETKSSGWAFVGEFIATGGIQDVAAGSVVLVYGEKGSRANPRFTQLTPIPPSPTTLTPTGERGRAPCGILWPSSCLRICDRRGTK